MEKIGEITSALSSWVIEINKLNIENRLRIALGFLTKNNAMKFGLSIDYQYLAVSYVQDVPDMFVTKNINHETGQRLNGLFVDYSMFLRIIKNISTLHLFC